MRGVGGETQNGSEECSRRNVEAGQKRKNNGRRLNARRKTGRVVLTFVCVCVCVYICINICVYNMLVASQEWDEEEAKVEAGQKRNRRNEFISANATS